MEFTVSDQAFHELWSLAGLGELPLVLDIRPAGFTEWERAMVLDAVHAELDRAGLLRQGRVDADAEGLLWMLHRPLWSVDARLWLDGSVRALTGVRGSAGTLAVLTDQMVRFRGITAGEVACAAVDLLPMERPAPQPAVSLPRELVDAAATEAGSDPLAFRAELIRGGAGSTAAAVFAGMARENSRRGQFGAAGHDRFGRRHRAATVVNVVDTAAGRYGVWDGGPAHAVHLHAVPADLLALSGRLDIVLDGIDLG